jgi:hypothetical protein
MGREKILIGQCLHGYDNGHSLLASSLELDSDAKRLLLLMSDMSGPQVLSGFEEYITGYAIKELGSFALAKTWYAGEMQRPGCVWTQTLLIRFPDLPKINQSISSALLSLFERPSLNLGFSSYEQPLYLDIPFYDYNTPEILVDSLLLKPILFDLYSSVKPVVIPSEMSRHWEAIFLKIWLQQWPRLQRNFSFCTGSMAFRSNRGAPLDLQVIPFSLKLQESIRNNVTYETGQGSMDQESAWLNSAYFDLTSPSELQSFLRKYGTDVKTSRLSFQTLAVTYLYFLKNNTLQQPKEIIQYLSTTFPKNDEANILKASVLGEVPEPEFANCLHLSESEILTLLATTPLYNSFDYSKLNFQGRFTKHLSTNPLTTFYTINEMISLDLNPHGEALVKFYANEAINYSNVLYSDSKFNHLLIVFAQLNPELCYHPEFWTRNLNNIAEIVRSLSSSNVLWQKIIDILISQHAIFERDLFNFNSDLITRCVLNSINLIGKRPNHSWMLFLEDNPKSLLGWVEENFSFEAITIEVIMDLLDPNSNDAIMYAYNATIKLLDNQVVADNPTLNIKVCSFGLALAFSLPSAKSEQLIARSLDTVYSTAKSEQLNQKCWRWIEIHTRPLAWWNEWDKCKKIAKALAKLFLKKHPNINFLYSKISDGQILDRIIRHMDKESSQ